MNSEILDRLPPHNLEAEEGVLCSILLDPKTCETVGPMLRPEDFYSEANAKLYQRMLAMYDEGKEIDETLLVERLKRTGDFEAIGGTAYMVEVAHAVAVPAHAGHYAGIVREKARYRKLVHAATDILRDAYTASKPVEEILARAESELLEITTGRFHGDAVDLFQAITEATIRMDELQDRSQHIGRLTGLSAIDDTIGGFHPQELVIVAARTGIGKTALATQIAIHNARKGRLVYFVSLEMSRAELATRILCRQANVNSRKIRIGRLTSADRTAIVEASEELGTARLKIHDLPGMTVMDIRREARKLARTGLALVVIDYLQLITPSDKRISREQQVATITRELKQAARELNVPVLCLCQLNRQADEGRPRLSHLRESGAVEQDADMVILLYPHEPTDKPGEDHNAYLEVAKHRAGEVKCFRMFWHGETTSFSCPERTLDEFRSHAL